MDKKYDKAAEAKEKEAVKQTEKKEADKKLTDEALDKVSGGLSADGDRYRGLT